MSDMDGREVIEKVSHVRRARSAGGAARGKVKLLLIDPRLAPDTGDNMVSAQTAEL